MGIFLLLVSTLMWSFVGVLVKSASLMVDSYTISFARFFFGIVFLGAILWLRGGKWNISWRSKWIWYGAVGKVCNYVFENSAITLGYAYGNILIMPMLMIFMMLFSIFYFKEKLTSFHGLAALFCLAGIMIISWNGLPIDQIFDLNAVLTGLFALSALGACFHTLSQKILIQSMKSDEMNWSVFVWCTLMTAAPLPLRFKTTGEWSGWAMIALILLGLITGISFYLYALALKKVTFMVASVLVNSSVIFTLLWSSLFLQEPITPYIVSGSLLFITGMILINIPNKKLVVKKSTSVQN